MKMLVRCSPDYQQKTALPKISFFQTSTKISLIPAPGSWVILNAYLSSAEFFSKLSFMNIIIVSNSLDGDQA